MPQTQQLGEILCQKYTRTGVSRSYQEDQERATTRIKNQKDKKTLSFSVFASHKYK